MAWSAPIVHATGDIVSASDWNIGTNDLLYLYGDTTEVPLTLSTNWANFGGGFPAAYVRQVGTLVFATGVVKNNTGAAAGPGVQFATVPAGYTPGSHQVAIADNNAGTPIRIDFNTNLAVTVGTGSVANGSYLAFTGLYSLI